MQSGHGSGLPELLALIQTLSSKLEDISLHELTDILEKDPVVVTRILAAANTVGNNPSIKSLTSLTHAVHQVGFRKVRNIAVSMMLLDNAAGASNSPEQRDAAAQSLCAGLIARSCAESLGYADPDLLFACGTLRNLGTVILPSISLEHCREANLRKEKMSDDIAYRSMFGVTPLELSRRIMSSLRMPEEVIYAMRDCQPEAMGGVATQHNGRILCIVEFSSQIAALVLSPKTTTESFFRHSRALAKRFERSIPDAKDLIDAAIEHTNEQLGMLTKQGGFIPSATFNRVRSHVKKKTPTHGTIGVPNPTTTSATAPDSDELPEIELGALAPDVAPVETDATETDDWAAPLSRSAAFETHTDSAVAASVTSEPEDPWVQALQTIKELMQADLCAVFLGRKGEKRTVLHRWTGTFGDSFLDKPVCNTIDRTVFGVCLTRRETVLIHDASDLSLNNYLPEWMQQKANRPGAFLLLPLIDEKQSDGFIYLAWDKPRKISISTPQSVLVRSLITQQILGQKLEAQRAP